MEWGDKMSGNNKRKKKIYTKSALIREVAARCGKELTTVRSVCNTLEDIIEELLSGVTHDEDVTLKVFKGISIGGSYVAGKTKTNNLTREIITTKDKVKPKAHFTKEYRQKINDALDEQKQHNVI